MPYLPAAKWSAGGLRFATSPASRGLTSFFRLEGRKSRSLGQQIHFPFFGHAQNSQIGLWASQKRDLRLMSLVAEWLQFPSKKYLQIGPEREMFSTQKRAPFDVNTLCHQPPIEQMPLAASWTRPIGIQWPSSSLATLFPNCRRPS